MITILEFSVTEERDIRPGYPEPDMCGTGWHCSICGEKVSSSHSACHMHEVGPRSVSGTFCALSNNKIPDQAQEIQLKIDDTTKGSLIITLKYAMIRPGTGMKGYAIVSSVPIDAQYKRVYYSFNASGIDYNWEKNNES